jgi:hypothetical protein
MKLPPHSTDLIPSNQNLQLSHLNFCLWQNRRFEKIVAQIPNVTTLPLIRTTKSLFTSEEYRHIITTLRAMCWLSSVSTQNVRVPSHIPFTEMRYPRIYLSKDWQIPSLHFKQTNTTLSIVVDVSILPIEERAHIQLQFIVETLNTNVSNVRSISMLRFFLIIY